MQIMDPLNYIGAKDSSEQISLLHEFEPFESHYLGLYYPIVDHNPPDDTNACIEYDLFMQILEEHNEPERAKKVVTGRRKGSPEYAQQREPNKMKNGIAVDGAIEKWKILQEDATEGENKWPKRKRFKKGSLEYAQRRELTKIKNRIAAARSVEKVQDFVQNTSPNEVLNVLMPLIDQNHILELERKAMRLRRRNDNRRKLLVHWAGQNAAGGFRPLRRTFSGPL